MISTAILLLIAAGSQNEPFTSPKSPVPEYGHGLSKEEAHAGWLSLFDGQSPYGWTDASMKSQTLCDGKTTSIFGSCELKGEAGSTGMISVGGCSFQVAPGKFARTLQVAAPGPIKLGPGISIKTLLLKPASLVPMFNGRDLTGWTIVRHPQLAEDRQTKWSVTEGTLRGLGGPGAVELDGQFGDVMLQLEVRMRAKLTNGGVFFRSIPGDFMNGYEAQLFNGCYGEDPARPARFSTGAIDDRQLARRLVSRDLEPFILTIVATGPHIATWVNGYQTNDFTDERDKHRNPREGLRLEPGTIQLQAHDVGTDIEFRRVLVGRIE